MIEFRALQLANEQQSAYGLRYNDFARYRKHCANRTHRLRSSLKMTHGSKGKEFKKFSPLTEMDLEKVKEGHLQLLLFESERAWAYAQELTSLSLLPTNSAHSASLLHHATGRFRRAINWATQLLSLTQRLYTSQKLTAESLLECTAYLLLLNGRFLLSPPREDFESSLPQLSVTRLILDILALHARNSRDQALAVLWSDQVGPMVRWCAHQMGREKAYDVDSIVKEVSEQNVRNLVDNWDALVEKFKKEVEDQVLGPNVKKLGKLDESKLMWEGEPVPIRNPELVDVLLRVQNAEAKMASSDSKDGKSKGSQGGKKAVAAYDSVLAALSDAEEVARKLSESEVQKASSSTIPTSLKTSGDGGQIRDMHFVHTYIVYQLLSRRIQRDLLLADALVGATSVKENSVSTTSTSLSSAATDPRLNPAIVKLLDSILQSLSQLRTLSIVDDSPDLSSAVDARIGFSKAKRCVTLAKCYIVVPGDKKYAEALTLLQHATIHLREARRVLETLGPFDNDSNANDGVDDRVEFYPLTKEEFDMLDKSIVKEGLEYKRSWLEKGGAGVGVGEQDGGKGKKQKKPVFFNIALNYVDVDMELMERLRERAGMAPTTTSSTQATAPALNLTQIRYGLNSSGSQSSGAPRAFAAAVGPRAKAAVMEEGMSRSGTPEPRELDGSKPAGATSRLGSLLGGWWGKN
ncbi:hypothetical protein J3R30DRAFT_1348589 [Lentinula aciculospora]|uniref:Signal recognition particle subunit SRP68 n=1 Tax=Lentinula aciculospora TaxID=153920 RepID=A0A9W9ANF5_9AGAR|nr:hypothetical protein J3R30DRAFT_1348589 [Lentinula aciculospora]